MGKWTQLGISAESDAECLCRCKEVLNNGGVAIFPTDTVYGIGCRWDRPDAIRRVFRIKQRPLSQPLALLVAAEKHPADYGVQEDEVLRDILSRWWPGPLTVVAATELPLAEGLSGPGNSIGLRAPDHEWLQTILREMNIPLVATSANRSGQPEVLRVEDLSEEMLGEVDWIVDGGPFPEVPRPSTVIGKEKGRWKIMREGAIAREILEPLFSSRR
ncbi:MAG TPA: L-threonylcarbamoyladenylate synthase [bacterium]|nr:L-threonylcarbamoyladenylate synthase [bacterium]